RDAHRTPASSSVMVPQQRKLAVRRRSASPTVAARAARPAVGSATVGVPGSAVPSRVATVPNVQRTRPFHEIGQNLAGGFSRRRRAAVDGYTAQAALPEGESPRRLLRTGRPVGGA